IMQYLASKHGFAYCGIIHIADGTPRLAYQRLMPRHVCQELENYCETTILPQYDSFDEAHQQPHIRSVVHRALVMADRYPVNKNMIYCAAVYHDIGCGESREWHHLISGRIIRQDKQLLHFFSPSQIEVIAQAAEDHRASAHAAPRSLYGNIIAEADRDLNPEMVVRRTVQFGLSQNPRASREQHFQRVVQHLREKYGPHGYMKLLLQDSPNRPNMERLHSIIADDTKLRELFERFFTEECRLR
ncbi:MAG: HD domain-containing protein, partial [Bacteroidales bacterium]|nr:HD domain-containing protein [Bacteroidales bacterium]